MSIWGSNGLLKLPHYLWRRLNISRANRLYRELESDARRMQAKKAKADRLMRKHAEDPQRRLPLGDD